MPALSCARPVFLMSFLSATMMSGVVAETVDVWFGTTTPRGGDSRGIYHAALNINSGKITKPTLAAETNSPGFLALHPDGKTLYATGSASGGNQVSAYRVEGPTGNPTLKLINSVDTGDGGAAQTAEGMWGR